MSNPRIGVGRVAISVILVCLLATGLLVGIEFTNLQTHTNSTVASAGATKTDTAPPRYSNESFQLVQALVGSLYGSATVNVTYHDFLPESTNVTIDGAAYSATTHSLAGTTVCCPVLGSVNSSGVPFSVQAQPKSNSQFSSVLALSSSLGAGSYLVKIKVVSQSGLVLSPVSSVFVQIGISDCGGQAGTGPLFYDEDNGLVYVANSGVDSISVVNGSTSELVATVSLPDLIGNLDFYLYDHGNRELYIGAQGSPVVFAIDTKTNFVTSRLITTGANQSLTSMVYDPRDGKIFGIDFVFSQIRVIDDSTNKVVANITGIQGVSGGVYDAKSDQVIVYAYNGTTWAIDGKTNQIVERVPTTASVLFYDSDNGLLYAAEYDRTRGETLFALDASTFRQVGSGILLSNSSGSFVLYDPSNKEIYFYEGQGFNQAGGLLIAVNTELNSVVAKIPVTGFNGGLVMEEPSFIYDNSNGEIYATEVPDPHTGTVGLLRISGSSNTIVSQTFPPQMPLNDIVLDPRDGILYGGYSAYSSTIFVLNFQSGKVFSIDVGTCQTRGLPP